jgi:hypothetical protein
MSDSNFKILINADVQGLPAVKSLLDLLNDLKKTASGPIADPTSPLKSGFDSTRDSAGKLIETLGGVSAASGGAGGAFAALGGEAGVAVGEIGELVRHLGELLLIGEAVKKTYEGVKEGLNFNAGEETATIGIASLVASLMEVKNAQGQVLEGADALNASYGIAADQMDKLRADAVNTSAQYETLVKAFRGTIAAGNNAGLNLDQLRGVVVGISQAAGAMGADMSLVESETRHILDGTINNRSEIAKGLGLKNEEVKLWKEQGTLVENLTAKLAVFRVAGADVQRSWAGLVSNLKDGLQQLAGASTEDLFKNLKEGLSDATSGIFTDGKLNSDIRSLASFINDVFGDLGKYIKDAIDAGISALDQLGRYIEQNRDKFNELRAVGKSFGDIIEQAASDVFKLAKGAGDMAIQWRVLTGIGIIFNLLLAAAYDLLRTLGNAILALAANLNVQLLGAWLLVVKAVEGLVGIFSPNGAMHKALEAHIHQVEKLRDAFGQTWRTALEGYLNYHKTVDQTSATIQAGFAGIDKARDERNRASLAENALHSKGEAALKDALDKKLIDEKTYHQVSIAMAEAYAARIRAINGDIAHPSATAASKPADDTEPGKGLQLAKAQAEARLAILREENKTQEDELKASLDRQAITAEQYVARKIALDQKLLAAEKDVIQKQIDAIKAQRGKKTNTDDVNEQLDGELAKAQAQITILDERGKQIVAKAQSDAAKAIAEYQKALAGVEKANTEATRTYTTAKQAAESEALKEALDHRLITYSDYLEKKRALDLAANAADRAAIDANIAQLSREAAAAISQEKKLEIAGQIISERAKQAVLDLNAAKINAQADAAVPKAQFDTANAGLDNLKNSQANTASDLQLQRASGALTDVEYQKQLREATLQAAAAMQPYVDALEKAAKADASLQPAADAAKRAMKEMAATADSTAKTINDSFVNGLAQGFEQLGTKSESLGSRLKGVLLSLVQSIDKILSEQLAQNIAKAFGSNGGSGGIGGFFSSLIGVAGFAEGGYVSGAGTSTSDSIPAMLSNGEFVIPADSVAAVGTHALDHIKEHKSLPRFAAGGLAGRVKSGGSGGGAPMVNLRTVNVLDPNLVEDGMSSAAGERVVLNHITNNASKIKNTLGIV